MVVSVWFGGSVSPATLRSRRMHVWAPHGHPSDRADGARRATAAQVGKSAAPPRMDGQPQRDDAGCQHLRRESGRRFARRQVGRRARAAAVEYPHPQNRPCSMRLGCARAMEAAVTLRNAGARAVDPGLAIEVVRMEGARGYSSRSRLALRPPRTRHCATAARMHPLYGQLDKQTRCRWRRRALGRLRTNACTGARRRDATDYGS